MARMIRFHEGAATDKHAKREQSYFVVREKSKARRVSYISHSDVKPEPQK